MELENTQSQRLRDKKVRDILTPDKRRLVEVPYTATLAHTVNALVANRVVAAPVAAPPGHWIGAGSSMILEADKQTGAVRKHYIGMITMLDILAHIAGDDIGGGGADLDRKMVVPVSTVIGHCLESLSFILDCMEVFSKGIHRALVPLDSHLENVAGIELVESASSYRMLTQMDLLRFLKAQESELKGIMSRKIAQLGGVTDIIFGVSERAKVIEVIKCMKTASLNAVPIIEASSAIEEDHSQLINGKDRKLVGTFSSTDLRECPISQMKTWLHASVLDFTELLPTSSSHTAADLGRSPRELVTCHAESSLGEVIDKAVTKHVHRVWVVDRTGLLDGLVSLTDMTRMIRVSLL
ncbi:SNF1-related protein kinase regulatory subunit gamma-like [Actinidia chinensis var. chinensis]|uniref:SNF1-related protein kinase regulatory subunit gamma-like n=1 Tax=Actinidia chinensis var. chinensis TaxID=1590841 RepID=A0A2R6PSK6_ACTCC|nr:SNF1-related protein kinase regulatory subunit gamma-like [Actinidia chinensis var. chinensis]